MSRLESPVLQPDDEFNRALAANVHPADWTNPEPRGRYDLVVLGAGTAGLVTAAGAAGLGARVALVEKHLLGGDCLNIGCVPSKALIRTSRAAAAIREASAFGVQPAGDAGLDFGLAMQRLRRLRARISRHDAAARFRDLGVDVFFGEAAFTRGGRAVQVGRTILDARRAVICTGARPRMPAIAGLESARPLTNETVFSLTELPRRMAIIGGGPVGCEMAQAFARCGSQVVLIQSAQRILAHDDEDAARLLTGVLQREGVELSLESTVSRVTRDAGGLGLHVLRAGEESVRPVDAILVAAGRRPNVENLNLDEAGVVCGPDGIQVDDRLRTTNRRIFAAGDVCSRLQFTHVADFLARIVIRNALFLGRAKASALTVPWCTYTSPEVAHVGLTEAEAVRRGIDTQTFVQSLDDVDRAELDGETEGFVKLRVRRGTDRILGGTIVAQHAGEMISELSVAITNRVGLRGIARTIHPYPTQADAIRKVADAYNRTRLTPLNRWLLKILLALPG